MGKILICSNNKKYEKLKKLLAVNFLKSYEHLENDFNLINYYKLRVKNENYYEEENNFIIGVGTYIYKNKIGKEALKLILKDYNSEFNKNKIIGSFAIGVMYSGKFSLFIDAGNTYNIYYFLENNEIILSNTVYHIAYAKGENEFDYDEILSFAISCVHTDNESFCKNIFRLSNLQTLEWVNGKWSIINEKSIVHYELGEKDIWEQLVKKIGCLNNIFSKSGVFMTGGQDSRIYLALMLCLGLKPTLYYGKGNSLNTCTKENDERAVKLISEKLNLPLKFMNWTEPRDKNDKINYINKYGEDYIIYNFNKNIFKEFEEKIDTELITFGYCGEMYRNVETITDFNKEIYTLNDYIDKLYIPPIVKDICIDYKKIRERIYNDLLEVCSYKEINPFKMTKDDFIKLNSYYRSYSDMKMNNFSNIFFYSIPFLGDGEIINTLENIKYIEKINSKFLMEGINKLEPKLLEVPFFSHIKEKKFNKETFELLDRNMTGRYKDKVREMVKNEVILKILRELYYFIIKDKKGRKELKEEFKEKEEYMNKISEIKWIPKRSIKYLKKVENRSLETIYLYNEIFNNLK